MPAALLHDAVEKTSLSWDDLREAGADGRLLAGIDALTERVGESIAAYLARCAADPLALRIKRYDLTDKLSGPAPRAMTARQAGHLLRDHALRRLTFLELAAASQP